MKWSGTDNDDVIDARGSTGSSSGGGGYGGGGIARLGGGGAVAVIVVVIVGRLFGVDLSGLLSGGSSSSSPPTQQQAQPRTGPDPDAQLVPFVKFVMKDVQNTFEALFKQMGKPYPHAQLVLFSSEINTGCGRSSAAIGPFYCPPDQKAYIDLSFYRELRERFGAPGEFAEAYVLAHEIGHHLQNLLGIEKQMQTVSTKKARNAQSVKLELQADCFAGVWGHSANERQLLDVGDVDQALTAAASIGDDRLEKQAGVEVNSETWTHGSSEMRVRWFRRGFDSGRLDQCDTFSAPSL